MGDFARGVWLDGMLRTLRDCGRPFWMTIYRSSGYVFQRSAGVALSENSSKCG